MKKESNNNSGSPDETLGNELAPADYPAAIHCDWARRVEEYLLDKGIDQYQGIEHESER